MIGVNHDTKPEFLFLLLEKKAAAGDASSLRREIFFFFCIQRVEEHAAHCTYILSSLFLPRYLQIRFFSSRQADALTLQHM